MDTPRVAVGCGSFAQAAASRGVAGLGHASPSGLLVTVQPMTKGEEEGTPLDFLNTSFLPCQDSSRNQAASGWGWPSRAAKARGPGRAHSTCSASG